jgi:two-component system nitrogen regulation sensor histidine kinase NtrY
LPGLGNVLGQAQQKPGKIAQAELPFDGSDGARKTLLVRIAVEQIGEKGVMGAVLTFDDITELQSAQRKAAWADVARRIAHEIKNPLTPIQLSAERLKRKYLKQIADDPETFAQCTDTIIDHVGDIGRMVNEFSAFARMPEPVIKRENLARTIRDLLTLQQQAHRGIQFNLIGGNDASVMANFDVQQIRQAFTNIVQNAIDSIDSRREQQKASGEKSAAGRIDVVISERAAHGDIIITVTDNGLGLPKNEDPARLTEPYVTHKEKGTGLGLAIVKKIMEDHKGRVVLGAPDWLKALPDWQDRGGASVSLILPVDGVEEDAVPPIEQRKAIS